MDIIDNRVANILEMFEPIDSDAIKKAFNFRLKQMQVSDVLVDDVDVDLDGNITVEFTGEEGDLDVVFTIDDVDGVIAFVEPDEEEDDFIYVDLSNNAVGTINTSFGDYPDLLSLSWLNKTTLRMILSALDIEELEDIPYNEDETIEEAEKLNELTTVVIKNGRKKRVNLVRRKRKKVLTPAQRSGIRKANVKRKAKSAQTSRKRKKSMKLRKRSNLKTNTNKTMKVRR